MRAPGYLHLTVTAHITTSVIPSRIKRRPSPRRHRRRRRSQMLTLFCEDKPDMRHGWRLLVVTSANQPEPGSRNLAASSSVPPAVSSMITKLTGIVSVIVFSWKIRPLRPKNPIHKPVLPTNTIAVAVASMVSERRWHCAPPRTSPLTYS